MNIQKLNCNTNCQPKFTARFPKAELQKVINESIQYSDLQERLPKLYTSLEYLDSILPDTKLGMTYRWVSSRDYRQAPVIVDQNNKFMSSGYSALDALEKIFLKRENNKNSDLFLLMPESVYENAWWKNRNVKVEDIEKFALDVNA